MSFGQRLKQLREENGLSQIAIANQLGITEEDINAFENDEAMPSAEILVKLSQLYNMSVDELLGNNRKTELPIAKAAIVNSKKQIKQALKFESSVSRMVLLIIGIGIALFFACFLSLQFLKYPPLQNGVGFGFLIYIIPFFVIYFISIIIINTKAKRYMNFMQGRSGFIEFYNNHLLVYLDGEQTPFSYSYSNFIKTSESDGYILFYLPNSMVYCVDKRQSEGYIESVSQILSLNQRHKNKSALKKPNEKLSVSKLLRMKNTSNILYTLSFFSLHLGLVFTACSFVSRNPLMKFGFLLAGIIPLCGLIYGIYIKIRKFRGKKLIITSAIFLCLTLLYGSLFALMPNPIANNSNFEDDKTLSEIAEDLESRGFTLEEQALIDNFPSMEQYYKAESPDMEQYIKTENPDSQYTFNIYEFSDAYSCNAFYSLIGEDLQNNIYSKRSYSLGNVKMLSFSTASEYFYKYTNGKIIVSIKADLENKASINWILYSLGLAN